MRIQSIILIAGLLAPCAALADQDGSQAGAPGATMQPASQQVVCNYYYHEGTVIRRPFCMSQAEVERRRLETQRLVREYQQKADGMSGF